MKVLKEDMLIFVNSNNNNNKFYHVKLLDNWIVEIEYGRVGTAGRKVVKGKGEYVYNKVIKEKIRKGYEKTDIVTSNTTKNVQLSKSYLLDIAMKQIKYKNEKVKELIKKLVDKNIHNITSNTNITYNSSDGLFSTPLGVVTENGIFKAKQLLDEISTYIEGKSTNYLLNSKNFSDLNEEYFKIIPTKIKNLREKSTYMLYNKDRIEKQKEICEALEETLKLIKEDKKDNIKEENLFEIEIDILRKNTKEYKRIVNYFEKSKNRQHGNYINSATIVNIYSVSLKNEEKEFLKDMKNIMELWHGTKVINILSIFKSGLLMPKVTPGTRTGAMFGDGLYFSDQSTKSLNYCDGMYWNNSKKEDKLYMFLADVAMGNYYVPTGPVRRKPPKGYDSYFAQGKKSGVLNNEMIVFDTKQIKLKYLLEIKI